MPLSQPPHYGHRPFVDRRVNSLRERRKPLSWPKDRAFRILSLDGGGIRGLYSAVLVHLLERNLGAPLHEYFDLIAGTSTGGIIAVALGLGVPAERIQSLYLQEGQFIFPPGWSGYERVFRRYLWARRFLKYKYEPAALEGLLLQVTENRDFGDSYSRLVIPAFLTPKAQIAVLKTDHHPDFKNDWKMKAWEVARATAAAPTFFPGHEYGDAIFLDGGLWANNPIMVAIVDSLSAFDISRDQIQCLSIGNGNAPYEISTLATRGGLWRWREIVNGAVFLTTDNAAAQADLLLGPERIVRLEPNAEAAGIELDDWTRAIDVLPKQAIDTFSQNRHRIEPFFSSKVIPRERFYSSPLSSS